MKSWHAGIELGLFLFFLNADSVKLLIARTVALKLEQSL